jgi:hypothetical protein
MGAAPLWTDEEERTDDVNEKDEEEKDPLLEEGEHLFATWCRLRDEEICAVATNS